MAPRRIVLDALLLEAARAAGAEAREGALLHDLIWRQGRVAGARVQDRERGALEVLADCVIGADGRNSRVARVVGAPVYASERTASVAYYAYWREFATDRVEIYFQLGRLVGLFPTHHGDTLIFVQWPVTQRKQVKSAIRDHYLATLRAVPNVATRLEGATQHSRILGMAELPGFFRQPFGPGWALVGDAGHHKDPLVARGISDAWRDSQLLADALIAGSNDERSLQASLGHYQQIRDQASTRVAQLNAKLARLDRPLDEMRDMWHELADAEIAADNLVAATQRRGR